GLFFAWFAVSEFKSGRKFDFSLRFRDFGPVKEIVKYSGCFVCGDKNPLGLAVKFYEKDGGAAAEFVPQKVLEGYRGLLHGGILSSLLDEVMIKAVLAKDVYCVTAELAVRYKKPVEIADKLTLFGYIEKENGRVYTAKGWAKNQKGELAAEAVGKYFVPKPEEIEKLKESLEI
ncbi:MAG: PaaI family thioesterase, partial [candidate division Zixibacteria bacterium]|nr:PaaI family thioesterase [candidate division Zixibacteria bacterium]